MGDWIFATAAVVALAVFAPGAEAAPTAPKVDTPAARSAESHGVEATYRGPMTEKGYSLHARRVADCLATYPGAYDPKIDRVRIGLQTRRCEL